MKCTWANSLFVLVCGVLIALCQGVWYSSSEVRTDQAVLEPDCVNISSELFSHHHQNAAPGIDQAILTISSSVKEHLTLCAQSDVCHNCAFVEVTELISSHNKSILVNTNWPITLRVSRHVGSFPQTLCRVRVKLDEHGRYSLYIFRETSDSLVCNVSTDVQPADNNILLSTKIFPFKQSEYLGAIYIAIGVYFGVVILWILIRFAYRRGWFYRIAICMPTERLVNSDLGTPNTGLVPDDPGVNQETQHLAPTKPRLRSLDTFRGLSLVIMVFVNYRGGRYWFFHHSAWEGLTVADLVFPWFVFIMGTSIAIAFKSQLRRGLSRKKLFLRVVRRSLILFALGLMVSNRAKLGREVVLSSLRIPGILQRLAFSYFVVATMEVFFAKGADIHQHKWWASVRDLLPYWPEWILAFLILAAHICVTVLLPVPNCPLGYLGPGGLHNNASHVNCTGGAAGHIDRWFFGENHIYQHPTSKVSYVTSQPFDPEGILGSLTSVFLCFLGLQAGKILVYHQDWIRRVKRWLIWCIILGVAAGGLCKFSLYDGMIPVTKNLWSVSYILANASMAYLLLIVCYLLVDVLGIWSGAPFFYPGMNSIVVYMAHEIMGYYFPIQFNVTSSHSAQLAMSLWGATFWTIVAAILYYKKIFIAI